MYSSQYNTWLLIDAIFILFMWLIKWVLFLLFACIELVFDLKNLQKTK
jgi:hypothetical protein